MERSVSATNVRTLSGDNFVDFMKSFYEYARSRVMVRVEGYDTSLSGIAIGTALLSQFKSCGEIHDIEIPRDPITNTIKSSSFVCFRGEGVEEKVMALNGSDFGGWKATIEVLPREFNEGTTDKLAAKNVAHFQRSRSDGISVTGYDPSLPADVVKSTLANLFSPCGLITEVSIVKSRASIYFYGIGAVRRAVKLCASDVGGWKLVAKALPIQEKSVPYLPPGCHFGSTSGVAAPHLTICPPFGSGAAAPHVHFGPPFPSVDAMDFEYTTPGTKNFYS